MLAAADNWQCQSLLRFRGTQLGLFKGVSTEVASVPAIDMRSITQLAEGDESGKEFIAEIIDVFLGDLRERVRKIGAQVSGSDLRRSRSDRACDQRKLRSLWRRTPD